MVKPFDYCRVSQWCKDKHFTNFSSYSKLRSSCHTTMKYFSISPSVSDIKCALSRSFNQEFISEISGIASGEFALEQQLQKAAIGHRDWSSYTSCYTIKTRFFGVKAESVISKAFEDIVNCCSVSSKGFDISTFNLDSTTCQRKSTGMPNIKSNPLQIVAVFLFWIFDTKSIPKITSAQKLINLWMVNLSLNISSTGQVVDAWADLILPIQQHRRDNRGMWPPWVTPWLPLRDLDDST